MDNNSPDIDLAKSVGVYFRLGKKEMDIIIDEVKSGISGWKKIATEIGIPRNEQTLMAAAFKI
jgi:serine/threonine-protein kinase HipA